MSNTLDHLYDCASTTEVARRRCCCRCCMPATRALPALRSALLLCTRLHSRLSPSLCLSQRLTQPHVQRTRLSVRLPPPPQRTEVARRRWLPPPKFPGGGADQILPSSISPISPHLFLEMGSGRHNFMCFWYWEPVTAQHTVLKT
jgi:hypothetical protein